MKKETNEESLRFFFHFEFLSHTLESGIDVAPTPENVNIRILIHFYTNQGIAVIFSKINKRTPTIIPDSRVPGTDKGTDVWSRDFII